ncbi:chorismate-binding protein [Rubritalea marina]|uniref:chorismate-binding protein n=1 Tax=Rubritalea marina TaxID=361055 RepID=UPI00037A5353|nr:chorismate-binding protein [Rubritalea marina]
MPLSHPDYAIFKLPESDQGIIGFGPFSSSAEYPVSGVAFYVNDFYLSDPEPWKIPSSYHRLNATQLEGYKAAQIEWTAPDPKGFAQVFSEINESIQRGVIEKSVPVCVERGELVDGDIESLLGKLLAKHEHFYGYAWVQGERGFAGLTPEMLFHLRKGRFKTMALAGTAKADQSSIFVYDEKEIREHEYVAQTLVASLSDIGMVERRVRQIMDLGNLVHFHTPIEVFMYGDQPIDYLLRKMHPTPALGPHPRTKETLAQLRQWRESLEAPAYFGAPFGLFKDGEFHSVVAIRGLHWQGSQISIPSGCGVIEASRLTNEWGELALKRSAVKQRFGMEA